MSYSEPAAPEGVELFSLDPEANRHPQEMYRALRAAAPVLGLDGMGHVLTTKEAAMEAFRQPEVFSSAATVDTLAMGAVRPLIPLQIDPPDHLKYRKILDPLFAPRKMAALEAPVAALVNDLIDGFVERGEVDFAQEFSVLMPTQVFLTLLGLPLADLELFLTMKDGIIRPDHVIGKPRDDAETLAYQNKIGQSIYDYFNRELDEREVARRDDLLSGFLDAEVDGVRLTREDILDICFLFFIAGLDTVSASLDCFFGYLCEHPEQREQLVADPSLVPSAVEELLRWETPVGGIMRVAAEDTELLGCPIKQGEMVSISLGSVDTDEVALPDAYEVRFDREVNPHNAFGGGVHRCLGSHLARLELRVALREWHRRIPEYAVKDGHELVYTPAIRSLETFPMVFGPTVFTAADAVRRLMARRLYLHETVDVIGQGQYEYMEHLWKDPVLRMPDMFGLQGSFYVCAAGGGRWPQVINIWDVGSRGWKGWASNVDRMNLKRRKAFYGEWWDEAAKWRSGGFDRLCGAVPGCPTSEELMAAGVRGTLFVQEALTVRPGAPLDFLAAVADTRVPLMREYGHEITGLYEVLSNQHEVVVVWATDIPSQVRLRQNRDAARGLDDDGEADDRLVAWERTAAEYVTGGDTHVMTPLPRTVYGPPDWEDASLEDWLES